MKTLLVIGVLLLIVLSVFAFVCARAPKGYEDSDGFHYGDPPIR